MSAGDLLGNERQILGAARSLRRAVRSQVEAERKEDQERWLSAKQAAAGARDRLLYFVETGHKAYPNVRTQGAFSKKEK